MQDELGLSSVYLAHVSLWAPSSPANFGSFQDPRPSSVFRWLGQCWEKASWAESDLVCPEKQVHGPDQSEEMQLMVLLKYLASIYFYKQKQEITVGIRSENLDLVYSNRGLKKKIFYFFLLLFGYESFWKWVSAVTWGTKRESLLCTQLCRRENWGWWEPFLRCPWNILVASKEWFSPGYQHLLLCPWKAELWGPPADGSFPTNIGYSASSSQLGTVFSAPEGACHLGEATESSDSPEQLSWKYFPLGLIRAGGQGKSRCPSLWRGLWPWEDSNSSSDGSSGVETLCVGVWPTKPLLCDLDKLCHLSYPFPICKLNSNTICS